MKRKIMLYAVVSVYTQFFSIFRTQRVLKLLKTYENPNGHFYLIPTILSSTGDFK